MNHWILAIADDLTGALETGAKFAQHGLEAKVTTEVTVSAPPDVPVLVIDTEARHLQASEAELVMRETALNARRFSPWLIYKKTDSALRGHIAAEFRALQHAFPERALIYAPAYPEMGRTVKNGRLFLWGMPMHESVFSCDLLNPVRESDINLLLGNVSAMVLDGESRTDIQAAARMVLQSEQPALAAGPAALAEALADCLPLPRKRVRPWPSVSRCLVVNGSLHPASIGQIAFARENDFFDDKWEYCDCAVFGSGLERALQTGQCVRRVLDTASMEALVVFGGDTAFGIHTAFGAPVFEPYGEIVPGVPLSFCDGLFWITKAGGFGERDILYDIRRHLT